MARPAIMPAAKINRPAMSKAISRFMASPCAAQPRPPALRRGLVLALIGELPGDGLSLRAPVIALAAHVGRAALKLAQAFVCRPRSTQAGACFSNRRFLQQNLPPAATPPLPWFRPERRVPLNTTKPLRSPDRRQGLALCGALGAW